MDKLKELLESTFVKDFKIIKEETYILNEGIEEIKKYYPKIDDNMIKTLVALDPTYKGGNNLGKYGKWILGLYNNYIKDDIAYKKWEDQKNQGNNYPKPIRKSSEKLEDFEKLPDLLRQYDVINNKVKNNIFNIKSISDLYSFVNNSKSQGISDNSKVNHAKDLVKKSVKNGGEIVFQDNNWIVLIPKTLKSSVVFGEDTNWCTTSPNGDMYNNYKQRYGGEYFINVNLTTGDLYQFHFESEQFMDSTDKEINIVDFLNNNQDLFNFYKNYFKGSLIGKSDIGILFVENPTEEEQIEAVERNGWAIKYIKNPSVKVQLAAIEENYNVFKIIKNPSEKVQLAAIKHDGSIIKYIKNPSEKVQLAAVERNGWAIEYIKNPSERVQLAAVERYGLAIEYIENPSEKVQQSAVLHKGNAIQYIKNPSEQLQLIAVEQNGDIIEYIENPSEKVQLEAVKEDGCSIRYIKNPTEKVQFVAVKVDYRAIQYIENPSEQLQLEAVKIKGNAIQYIKNPSEAAQIEAVRQNPWNIGNIKNSSEAAQIEAVRQNPYVIRYIENPSEKVQLEAVKNINNSIEYIKNPTPKVKEYVEKMKNIKESKIPSLRVDEKKFKSSIFNVLFESNILTEDIEAVKKYFPKVPEEKIQTLIKLDPTFKGGNNLGKYGKWILGLYNKGQLKDEDFYKVTEYLTTFTNNLSKMPNKDIMTYKSLPDLAKAIQPYEGQKDISKKQQVRDIKKGAKKVMETKNWLVISPTTKEAACYYGANTKWCTAAKEFNQFDNYNDRGPLYIFINKEDNTKFQFHAETFQFMNELDESVAPKKVINDEELIKFIEVKCVDATYDDNYDIWDDSILQGLYQDEWEGLYIETNIHDFFDSIFSENDDILRQAVNIVENYYMGEIVNYLRLYDENDVTFNSTIKKLFKLYLDNRKLNLQHINTMKYYGFDYIGNDEIREYINKIDTLKDGDSRIYNLFEDIENEIIRQLNQHLNFFKVKNIDYEDDYIKIYVDTIYDSETIQDANIDWFMNVNETLYRDNIFEEIANKIETPKTNNEIIAEMLIHGIIKILNEEQINESFNIIKNPKNDDINTYLMSTSLRFAFNPMNNDFIICDDLHNPIPLNESVDKYITGILSPNLVEITSKIDDDYDDSKRIVESLLGKRFKKIFKNHYEIIL